MAPNFERNLNQVCTYWVPSGSTDLYGKGAFNTPVLLNCRWEDIAEIFIDKTGEERHSKSRIFLAQDIALEGYLALGDQTATSDPRTLSGAWEVRNRKASLQIVGTSGE